MLFRSLLDELGHATGLPGLVLDEDNEVSLLFDEEHELGFVLDEPEKTVFVYADLASSDAVSGDAVSGDAALRSLLTASCLGAETGGAAFALRGNRLILWKRYDSDFFTDYNDLEKAVNSFLGHLVAWKARLAFMPRESAGLRV